MQYSDLLYRWTLGNVEQDNGPEDESQYCLKKGCLRDNPLHRCKVYNISKNI